MATRGEGRTVCLSDRAVARKLLGYEARLEGCGDVAVVSSLESADPEVYPDSLGYALEMELRRRMGMDAGEAMPVSFSCS